MSQALRGPAHGFCTQPARAAAPACAPLPFLLSPHHHIAASATTAQNAAKVHSHIVAVNDLYSEVETDENGDEVWEEVYVRTAKRNADGTVALDAGGRPIVGHDPISRPNLVYSRHYILRQIAKDDMIAGKKADADGVLVARLF